MVLGVASYAWFYSGGLPNNRIRIAWINEYDVLMDYDLGDSDPAIVGKRGGGRLAETNAFVCSWPISIQTFFYPRVTSDGFGPYTSAKLEYHEGIDATTDTNWVTIARLSAHEPTYGPVRQSVLYFTPRPYGELHFDGNPSYAICDVSPNVFSGVWSTETWFKVNAFTGEQTILWFGSAGTSTTFGITVKTNGTLCIQTGTTTLGTILTGLTTGTWYHVAATVDRARSNITTFVENGTVMQTFTNTPITIGYESMMVGARFGTQEADPNDTVAWLNGVVSTIRLFSYARYTEPFVPDRELRDYTCLQYLCQDPDFPLISGISIFSLDHEGITLDCYGGVVTREAVPAFSNVIIRTPVYPLKDVEGSDGAHFGVLTWTPPDVSNAVYLIRLSAEVGDGILVSSDQNATGIAKDGDGDTWQDSQVVAIKVIPHKRPGF